jgi:hypothetical protein
MSGIRITQLPEKITAPEQGDFFVVDDGTAAEKVDFNTMAAGVVESYETTLAGETQTVKDAIDGQATDFTALKTDVGSLLAVANIEITGTMANASRFGDVTAPTVSGYKFIAWINVASIGNISALYIASPTTATTAVWCVTTVNAGSNKTVRCTALYQKVVE